MKLIVFNSCFVVNREPVCSRSRPLSLYISNGDNRRFTVRMDLDGEFYTAGRIPAKGKEYLIVPEKPGRHEMWIRAADVPEDAAEVKESKVKFKSLRHLIVHDGLHDKKDIDPGYIGRYADGRMPVLRTDVPAVMVVDEDQFPAATLHLLAKSCYYLPDGRHTIGLFADNAEWRGYFDLGYDPGAGGDPGA